ncbi:MAG TPA: RNA polymerase subunit sigma-70 [Planctomycetaceae bacterium]|nr:RNA polymerase subunit sigma-70 [Planctomycetaceae bacterium]
MAEKSFQDSNPDLLELTDEQLLARFVQLADRAAFEVVVRRYRHEIYNYLRRYLGSEDMAEDAFQLAFLRVYQKAEKFDPQRRFRPWLYGVVTNQAIDLQRKCNRQTHQSLDWAGDDDENRGTSHAAAIPDHRQGDQDQLVEAEFRQRMRASITEVGEPGKSALELIYLQGLSYKDAAEALDVPVGTVKSRVHAAVRKLAGIWERNNTETAAH